MQQSGIDEIGRSIRVPQPVERIVSLVPSLTEWLCALGAVDRIVGVTDFCIRPRDALVHAVRLRGTKNPDRAAIIALQPDLVLANKEENRERDVLALEAAGIAVYVTDPQTVGDAISTLERVARLIDAEATAAPYLNEMRAEVAQGRENAARVRVLVPIWRDPWMAIGAGTYANDLLHICGAQNSAATWPGRYPRFELGAVAEYPPDVVLLPSEPYAFSAADLPALRAVFEGPIEFVDGELLTWYGPRLPEALRTFRSLLTGATRGES